MTRTAPSLRAGTAAALAAAVALAGSALHAGHHGEGVATGPGWLRLTVLLLPLAYGALLLGARLADRLVGWAGAAGATAPSTRVLSQASLMAALTLPVAVTQVLPAATTTATASSDSHAGHDVGVVVAGVTAPAATTLLAQVAAHVLLSLLVSVAVLALAELLGRAAATAGELRRSPRMRRAAIATLASGVMVVTPLSVAQTATATPAATAASAAAPASCRSGAVDRTYDVAAINVHLVYNRWGQGNPDAQIYVLQHDKLAVRDWDEPLDTTSSNRRLRPRPLVLRANEGECVAVRFTNELDVQQGEGLPNNPRASMYVRGVPFDVQTSGGSHVGYNEDTTVGIGETVTYYWTAHREGIYFFNDNATPAGSEADGGSLGSGLYGAFVVEPAGSTWTDPVSGDPLYTGTLDQSGELYIAAIITPPSGNSFREFIQLAQDEMPVTSTMGFNYASEDTATRMEFGCPDCVGEETSLSSWVYGDPGLVKLASGFGPWLPGTPAGEENCGLGQPGFDADSCFTASVLPAYKGDPTKIRYGMAGVKETHVFHLHAHTWQAEDQDDGAAGNTPPRPGPDALPESTTIDSQTFGPMEMFTADLNFGAGSKNGTVGDSIFHCHLYPHFVAGFWGLLRVLDVRERGTAQTPDGLNVWELEPLPARPTPDEPTANNPGYPRFIPGEFGWRAPQPPLGVTEGGSPATRYVAGEALSDSSPEVQLEQAAMNRLSSGQPRPGAPFGDPCPRNSREVTYNVSVIQTPIVYNERGDFDAQGRILVLDRDVDAILAGRKKPEPLFARVNQGDCINWKLTNRAPNWFGDDAFVQLQQTNMFGQHIHLVKFDVMASDGASNGWNYQQGAFSAEQAKFNADIATNPGTCTPTSCRIPTPASYDFSNGSKGLAPGQTITERWYADYELRTVFTHDHHFAALDQNRGQYGAVLVEPLGMDFRDPVTGSWFQPINDPAHGPVCGNSCTGRAAGATMDVIGPGPDDDFREFGLAIADFVSLTRGGGDPRNPEDSINPPDAPEAVPGDDPGTMSVNYRNAPLELRREKNGQAVDPAYIFSSHVFGDPMTPVLQAYSGDDVRVRLIQGAQEEQHTMMVHGVKWRREVDDPGSHFVNALPVGVSEAFNFEAPRLGCPSGQDCRGDYLYTSAAVDDMWSGMWGLMRVNGGRIPDLLPLPDNPINTAGSVPQPSPTAMAPPARTGGPGQPCPTDAPRRQFDVVAMQTKLVYNDAGEHDPYGLVYALAEDEQAIRDGEQPEPLVIRANQGDCVEVTLTNKLTPALQQHTGEGDANLPGRARDARWVPGLRVSMHNALLQYDVRGSDGAAIGYNADQTVAPGKSMMYRWYADKVTSSELGGSNLSDYGDVIGHRHHGLFGSLVVEPKNATWHDPATGEPLASGTQADIRVKGAKDFRESVIFFQDGLNLRHADGSIIEDPLDHPPTPEEPEGEPLDAEDSGEKGFNYTNEPFRHRLGYEPVAVAGVGTDQGRVYDSHRHGDPATPLVRAYEGDELKMRIIMANDKPRQHSFSLGGHSSPVSPDDPHTRHVGTRSGLGPGMSVNADMGTTNQPGDYLYGCDVGLFHRSGGLWGMLRVYPQPGAGQELVPTRIGAVDDPRAGGHPLLPLELDQLVVTVFEDLDGDGVRDNGEPVLPDATVEATASGQSRVTDADGVAYLSLRQGNHPLAVAAPDRPDLVPADVQAATGGNNDRRELAVGLVEVVPPGVGRVELGAYEDLDGDGTRDAAEPAVAGVEATLLDSLGAPVIGGTTDDRGALRLDTDPGSYGLQVVAPDGWTVSSAAEQVEAVGGRATVVDVGLTRNTVPRALVRVKTYLDRDRDGRRDAGERGVRRVHVVAYKSGELVARARTNRRGIAVLRLPARSAYRIDISPPGSFRSTPGKFRVKKLKPGQRVTRLVAVRRR